MNRTVPVFYLVLILFFGCDDNISTKSATNNTVVDSIEIITTFINNDSLNEDLFAKRAKIFLQRGNINQALRDIQTALDINSEKAELFILLSDVYLVLGQTDNSILSLKKAIKLNPDDYIPLLKLSEVYLLLEDPETAIRYANKDNFLG